MSSLEGARAKVALTALAVALPLGEAACKHSYDGARADLPLDQTFTTPTKLLTLHYPSDFVASTAGEHSASLAPMAKGALHPESEVYFTANMTPISNQVTEYARVILDTLARGKTDYNEITRTRAPCFKGIDGIEHVATFSDRGHAIRRWSCTFLANGHGFSFGTFVAVPDGERDQALLRRIVEAAEIARPAGARPAEPKDAPR
jgi:hypothetical protein